MAYISKRTHFQPLSLEQINKYLLKAQIGTGAFSNVYLGVDIRTHEKCVCRGGKSKNLNPENFFPHFPINMLRKIVEKIIFGLTYAPEKYVIKSVNLRKLVRNGDAIAQLAREIHPLRTLSRPNILKLIEVLHVPETEKSYLALEHAENGCVGSFIERGQKIPVGSVLTIIKQMEMALQHLHDAGYVHQDIKPWSILLDGTDRAMLADFGIGHSFPGSDLIGRG